MTQSGHGQRPSRELELQDSSSQAVGTRGHKKGGEHMRFTLITAVLLLTAKSAHAQFDRGHAELLMRELMPTNSHCGTISRELIAYCRYETQKLILELAIGPDGPQSSLTYDIENSEGRKFLGTIRRFFARLGVQEKLLSECIEDSKSQSSEVKTGGLRIKCLYANIADDSVAYEIFAERMK